MNVIEIAIILVGLGFYFVFRIHSARSAVGTVGSQVARLERIRYVARFFIWLCCGAFGFMIFVTAFAIIMPGMVGKSTGAKVSVTVSGPILIQDFDPAYKALYPVFWLGLCALGCWGIGFLHRLFANMEKGVLFGRDNVRCIRGIGWLLVAAPLLAVGFDLSKLIWSVAGPGMIDLSSLPNDMLKGLFVIFIAWIMDEGRKIQEEQELTV